MAETGGSPSRNYIVLEEQELDDGQPCFVQVHEVHSRNSHNALRKAFRELRATTGGIAAETTLVVIPESMWRPTSVRATVREQVAVG